MQVLQEFSLERFGLYIQIKLLLNVPDILIVVLQYCFPNWSIKYWTVFQLLLWIFLHYLLEWIEKSHDKLMKHKTKRKNKYMLERTYLFTAASVKALIKIILGIYLGKQASLNVLLRFVP